MKPCFAGSRQFLQKLVRSSGIALSILDTHLTDTLFIRSNAQNIYSPKVIAKLKIKTRVSLFGPLRKYIEYLVCL